MERWKLRCSGNCPFSDSPEEHTTHILQCNQEKPTIAWKQALADWKKKLTTQKTSTYLLRAIIFELKAWRSGTTLPTVEHYDRQLQEVILEQRQIGWKNFLEGLLSQKMVQYQSAFYTTMDTKKRGMSWATKMIRANWEIIHAIWLYRNDVIHEIQTKLKELEGVPLLNQVIKRHWNVGVRRLPLTEFSYMFRITLTDLIKNQLIQKSRG